MDRPQREKKPTEKVKPASAVAKKNDDISGDPVVPQRYVLPDQDSKWYVGPKEVAKFHAHTKRSKVTGESLDFYRLGHHVEGKDRLHYTRASRDRADNLFRNLEPPPFYARLSDEEHPLCAIDASPNYFSRDMLSFTSEVGNSTARANVFAREGTYYWEAKIRSQAPERKESDNEALITTQVTRGVTINDTQRGSVMLGFARREHHSSQPIGSNAYSYAVKTFGQKCADYGNVYHRARPSMVRPINPGSLKEGDVVGLMITLPTLAIHQKVVEGTFDQAVDAPHLSCGPARLKRTKSTAGKGGSRAKSKKPKQDDTPRASVSENENGVAPLPIVDIVRLDRFPIIYKNLVYHESTEYAQHRDLTTSATKGKGMLVNPLTDKPWDLRTDTHPNHEIAQFRTLPGSKIEMWVNGVYQGVAWEHLLAFLPPASYVEPIKGRAPGGAYDDGTLGYYPAVSMYGGGAVTCKFEGPWWCGPPSDRPEAEPFASRYKDQIVEDVVADIIDDAAYARSYAEMR